MFPQAVPAGPAPAAPAPQQTAPPTAASAGGAPPPAVPQVPPAGTPTAASPEQTLQQRLSETAAAAQAAQPANPAGDPTGKEFLEIKRLSEENTAYRQQVEQQQMLMQQWQPLLQAAAAHQRQQQLAAQQAQPAAQPQASPTGVPQFDRSLMAFITQDDKGNLTALPGAPPGLVQQYQQYRQAAEQFLHTLTTDPMKALGGPISKLVEERAAALYQRQQQEHESRAHINDYVQRNAAVLWARGADGGFLSDMAGNKVLTDTGRQLLQAVNQITQSGVTDGRTALQLAHQYVNAQLATRQQAQPQQTPPPAAVAPPAPAAPAYPASPATLADQVRQQWVQSAAQNPAGPATAASVGVPAPAASPAFQPRPGNVVPDFQTFLRQQAAAAGYPGMA